MIAITTNSSMSVKPCFFMSMHSFQIEAAPPLAEAKRRRDPCQ